MNRSGLVRPLRVSLVLVFLVILLVPVGTVASGNSFQQQPPANQQSTHTLVVTAENGTGRYIVTATGNTTLRQGESSDVHQPPVVQGSIKSGDRRDVIQYTGYITSFKYRGSIQVTIDGRPIPAKVLKNGKYLNISHISGGKTSYNLISSGVIYPGGDAENFDQSNQSRVQEEVSTKDKHDSFYYTGKMSAQSQNKFSASINGNNVSVGQIKSTDTSPDQVDTPSSTDQTDTGSSSSSPIENPDRDSNGNGGLSVIGILAMAFIAIAGLAVLFR